MNLLKNNKGVTTLLMVGAVSTVASIIIAFGTVQLINSYSSKIYFLEDWQKAFVSEKAAAIGAYLVSNNLVWCRQEAWKSGKKCKWGGGSQTKKVDLYSYLDDDSDGEANLTYKLDIDVESFKVEDVVLSFDLVDLNSEDDLAKDIKEKVNFAEKNTPEVFDKDHYVVLIRTKVPYKTGNDQKKLEIIDRVIRRPFAFVQVQFNEPANRCKSECKTSEGNSDHKTADCLSLGEVSPDPNHAAMTVKVVNQGPGILYKLNLLQRINYTDASIPADNILKNVVFSESDPDAVLLPNVENAVSLNLQIPCRAPSLVETVSSSFQLTRAWGRSGTTSNTTVSQSLHLQQFATTNVTLLREKVLDNGQKESQIEPARIVNEAGYHGQSVPAIQRVTTRNVHTHIETVEDISFNVNPWNNNNNSGDGGRDGYADGEN